MRTVISKDGTPIAFDQSGQGPAIILVAGATATRLSRDIIGRGPGNAVYCVRL